VIQVGKKKLYNIIMKEKKLLILTLHFPPTEGGIERYIHGLISPIADQVEVVTFRVSGWEDFDRKNLLKVTRGALDISYLLLSKTLFRIMLIPLNIILFFIAWKIIRKGGDFVVVSGSADSSPAAHCLSCFLKVPFVVITYGKDIMSRGRASLWKELVLYPVLRRANLVIAISHFTGNVLLKKGVARERIEIIYPGVDQSLLVSDRLEKDILDRRFSLHGKQVLLSAGRLVARKGHQKVIKVMPKLLNRYPELHYLIVGDGPYRQNLEKIVHDLRIESHVTFTGQVSQYLLNACYQRCRLMVMPSESKIGDIEGFGIVYLEAGFFSKPVIAAKGGGVSDAVEDGVTGLMVEPDNPHALTEAILSLLDDDELVKKLGEGGRQKALMEIWPAKTERFYYHATRLSSTRGKRRSK